MQACVAAVAAGLVEGGCSGLAALVMAELARMGNTYVRTLLTDRKWHLKP